MLQILEICREPTFHVGFLGKSKNLGDKDFAELSGELSGPICLETLVLPVMPPQN